LDGRLLGTWAGVELPNPRGELSGWLAEVLRAGPEPAAAGAPPDPGVADRPAWEDDDLQLALWCCYELHYRGFDDVSAELEWSPRVIEFRTAMERRWLADLRVLTADTPVPAPGEVPAALRELVAADTGPSLSDQLRRGADRAQFAEFLAHRSVYQLKEADPHSFGIPRLDGPVKAALVEIQADEYGGGRPERMHAELFRTTMREFGLDDRYGRYVPVAPAATLAISNAMSTFAVHRRWLGALLGHLAALETTSTGPNRRYSLTARRLGASPAARHYFDEHVEADAVHEQIALHDVCGRFAVEHPHAAGDVLFGAACCLALDRLFAEHLLERWRAGGSALLPDQAADGARLRSEPRPRPAP
jgi:hypothetical protein